ncbi:MAG: response regulator [Acidobacteria bacterium]|nr:response regulator [Acidobacteriota bacterium]
MRILLVEDSRVIRRENQAALLKAGYEVVCAEDGEIALQMAQELTPDLILLDMILPKINGPEVLQQLKKNPATSEIPVVVVSSLSEKNRDKLIQVGAEEYLEKNELMPSRGVNLLPERLEPIIRNIHDRKEASKRNTVDDSSEEFVEIGDLDEFEEFKETE